MDAIDYGVCGIYAIVHKSSGKHYIGQAQDIKLRWSVHLATLRRGSHHCTHLQRAWNKYGGGRFIWKVLRICEQKQLNRFEQYWMDCYRYDLFNIQPLAGSARGFKHSDSSRQAMSKSAKIIANTPAQRRMRSERAKRQHAQRNFGRYGLRPLSSKLCKSCKREFKPKRFPDGTVQQSKYCKSCRPPHYGGYYKYDHGQV